MNGLYNMPYLPLILVELTTAVLTLQCVTLRSIPLATKCSPQQRKKKDLLSQYAPLPLPNLHIHIKKKKKKKACTGAEVEMITSGGELNFVTRMIEESRLLDDQVLWYTAMLGKLSSVTSIVETLITHHNHNYAVTEFIQGSKTRRWAVAWSWTDLRPAMVHHPPSTIHPIYTELYPGTMANTS